MPEKRVQFDEFEVDFGRFELSRSGEAIRLEGLPLQLLMFLLENPRQLVTREQIADALWGKDVFVDIEQGINTAVRKVRMALGDDSVHPRYLQTVVGKGYRFVAKTIVVGDPKTPDKSSISRPKNSVRPSWPPLGYRPNRTAQNESGPDLQRVHAESSCDENSCTESDRHQSESNNLMKAIQVKHTGGPEVMELVDLPIPEPKPTEAVVKVAASGVNFIDVYHREGRYKAALPFILGQEGAGVVHAVGADVKSVKKGDRVAWTGLLGGYAEYASVAADRLVPIPAGVSDQQAAAAMLQGMTAHYLAHDTYPLKREDTALVHAAAGGVGLLLVQMAHNIGARVIGTVSTEEKAKLAREAGADEIILYTQFDFEVETKRLTGGKGVDVVYDSVGKTTFEKGLNILRPRRTMVLFGGSSGAVPPFDPIVLTQKGSLFLTRPSLNHYIASRDELVMRSDAVFGMIASGKLKLRIEHTYPLAEAQRAHRDLEGRKTTGKLLLIP